MSLWVKICANTSLQDAQLAAEFGADAVGFVFAPSKRRVTAEQVAAITPSLPAAIEKIGVFTDAPFAEIAQAVKTGGLTGVQLHFEASSSLVAELRERFGPGLRLIRTLHVAVGGPVPSIGSLAQDPNLDGILVDSKTATDSGGTGQSFDWDLAATSLFRGASGGAIRFIAAGGLTPENVAEAARVLQPWGVDVASGVESSPGQKDAAKLRAFIANARSASAAKSNSGS